jgi:hypothetical protein
MNSRLLGVLGGVVVLACGCGSDSPAAPSIAQVAGVWTGTATLTAALGGECVGPIFQRGAGIPSALTASITQNGSALTATVTSQGTGAACTYSGTAGGSVLTLNMTSCQLGAFRLQCSNGAVRDISLLTEAINGTAIGSQITGTASETWNTYLAGTAVPVGVLNLTSTFLVTRR